MTLEDAAAHQDPDGVPWIRNPDLVAYLNRKVAEEAANKKTITEIARLGGVHRTQFNRWRGIGGPQSIPNAANLIAVCEGNGWPTDEPLRILGWGGEPDAADDGEIRSVVDSLLEVLRDEHIDDADSEEALAQLRLLDALLRARAERRRREQE